MKLMFLQAMIGFGMLFMGCCAWVLLLLISIFTMQADKSVDAQVQRKKIRGKVFTIIIIVVLISLLMIAMGTDDHPIN